jgi:hypothetical protein
MKKLIDILVSQQIKNMGLKAVVLFEPFFNGVFDGMSSAQRAKDHHKTGVPFV